MITNSREGVGYTLKKLFEGIPDTFSAVRYHSWHLSSLPSDFIPIAYAEDGVLMAMCHQHRPHVGVQFHPESIDTEYGVQLIRNFFNRYLSEMQSEKRVKLHTLLGLHLR